MMRVAQRLTVLAIITGITLMLIAMSVRGDVPQRYVPGVDPNFSTAKLSADQRLWYERLWQSINGDTYPNPDFYAASNDTYSIGRTLQPHILALYTAFRATGDVRLLDEMDRLMEIARAQLADTNGDGYLNWLWQNDSNSIYYQTDLHEMDEILAHSLVAFYAYVIRQNEDIKPQFRQHADFWQDYLINHFMAKWAERGGGSFRIDKSLAHPYAHLMTFYYYLYRLTGDLAYLEEAERRADVLNGMMVQEANGSFTWDHRVPNMGNAPIACQWVDYARYTLSAFQEMAYEGFSYYADDEYMAHYAVTIRENILKQNGTVIADDVCGSTIEPITPMRYSLSFLACYSRWDASGRIERESVELFLEADNDPSTTVFVPACMVWLLNE